MGTEPAVDRLATFDKFGGAKRGKKGGTGKLKQIGGVLSRCDVTVVADFRMRVRDDCIGRRLGVVGCFRCTCVRQGSRLGFCGGFAGGKVCGVMQPATQQSGMNSVNYADMTESIRDYAG